MQWDPSTWLLISDVDDTVLGDEQALGRFADFVAANRQRLQVVYSSGRFVASIEASIQEHNMPEPDWIIGGVGTEIKAVRAYKEFAHACEPIAQGWQRRLAATYDATVVRRLLSTVGMTLQPEPFQSHLKTSYYTSDNAHVAEARQRLKAAGWKHQVIYSSQRDVDVLPEAASKRGAACYLAQALGCTADRVICSGDSGNDLDMLTCGFQGVIVANHRPELADVSGPRIHRAQAAYADGVVEGMQRWMQASAPAPGSSAASGSNAAFKSMASKSGVHEASVPLAATVN